MNAEGLLEHYERIADTPDAITRLRRLVIDLATRGKLVPQHPEEMPAKDLMSDLARHRSKFKNQGILSDKQFIKGSHDNKEIPQGWIEIRAAELFPTRSGNSKLIKGKLHRRIQF